MRLFEKKVEIFQNRYMRQFFFYNASQLVFFIENVFRPYFSGSFGKNQKKIKVGKVRKSEEETKFWKKTPSSL